MDELGRKTVAEFKQAEKTPVIVVLDNIRSMHNVGSVFRTADAFLIEGVCLCGYTPQPPHRDIHKTALGIEQTEGSQSLETVRLQEGEKMAVVFGNEVEGVDQEVLQHCDGCIEIPQLGMKHSLNISVAAGIVLWKLAEQRFVDVKASV
jgi:23S rRNA (guanosine2251-2'-O)-methyltransferase